MRPTWRHRHARGTGAVDCVGKAAVRGKYVRRESGSTSVYARSRLEASAAPTTPRSACSERNVQRIGALRPCHLVGYVLIRIGSVPRGPHAMVRFVQRRSETAESVKVRGSSALLAYFVLDSKAARYAGSLWTWADGAMNPLGSARLV